MCHGEHIYLSGSFKGKKLDRIYCLMICLLIYLLDFNLAIHIYVPVFYMFYYSPMIETREKLHII